MLLLVRKHSLNKNDYFYSQNLVFKVPLKTTAPNSKNQKVVENSTAKVVVKVKFINNAKKTTTPAPVFPNQMEPIVISSL